MEQKLRLTLYLKMLIGFIVGFLIAYAFSLPYSYTAGVITVLHLWYSRDSVFKAALTRLIASLVGLAVSAFLFYLFGYTIWNLFLMVVVVLAILYLLRIEYGATIALVLIGQQWAEQTAKAPLNALIIMVIGTSVALGLNAITFRRVKDVAIMKEKLDRELARVFTYFAKDEMYDFKDIKSILKETRHTLQVAFDNYRVENIEESLDYVNTRAQQISILAEIVDNLHKQASSPYKEKIITFLLKFHKRIGLEDFASDLLVELDELYAYYRALALPETRDEFEHRALLFVTLADIKRFLELKIAFHKEHPHTK